MRYLIVMCIMTLVFQPTFAGDVHFLSADEVLVARYKQLQQNLKPGNELNRHQQLMRTSRQLLALTDEAYQASKKLEEYTYTVRKTGIFFDTPLQEVKKFHKSIKRLVNQPALKGFDRYMRVQKSWVQLNNIRAQLSRTSKNPNIPPSAKRSLVALQSIGLGLQQLGKAPVIGAALQGYGDIIGGLAKTLNNAAGHLSATAKAGIFSNTEEHQILKGLDRKYQYAKTPLWQYGIRLVHQWPYAIGKEKYFIQQTNGQWRSIQYSDVAEIAASYQLVYKKNINAKLLWNYLNNKMLKNTLLSTAETKLEFKRIEEIVGDIPGVNRKHRYSQFSSIEQKALRWHKQLLLPLNYKLLSSYIRTEFQNPGVIAKSLRHRVINAYPEFRKYLDFLEVDKSKLTMPTLLKLFSNYKNGKHLLASLEIYVKDANSGRQLPHAIIELRGAIYKTISARNGKTAVTDIPPGKYRISIKSEGYKTRSTDIVIKPMTRIVKTARLYKLNKSVTHKPSNNKPVKIKEPPVKHASSGCYAKKYLSKVNNARRINASNDPSKDISIVLLDASPQCKAAHTKCYDAAFERGVKCRNNIAPSSDPVAATKKCSRVVTSGWIKCALEENDCSEAVFRAKCHENTTQRTKKPANNCYATYYKKVQNALKANAANDPSGNMGIILLNGSAQCDAQHKKCSDAAFQRGVQCRNHIGANVDPVAATKKCNIVVNKGWIECAQQEVKCSDRAFRKKCGM